MDKIKDAKCKKQDAKYRKKLKRELIDELERKEKEVEEYIGLCKRLKADFDNFKKQKEREFLSIKKTHYAEVIKNFLEIYDSLERGKEIEGVSAILKQFEDVLKRFGVERIETEGAQFDPALHNALSSVPSDLPEGRILEEVSSGFVFGGELLRPASVIVAKKR
jgi:molecular chaperone GrpE